MNPEQELLDIELWEGEGYEDTETVKAYREEAEKTLEEIEERLFAQPINAEEL